MSNDLKTRVDAMAKLVFSMGRGRKGRRSRGNSAPESFMYRCGCDDCKSRRLVPFAVRVDKIDGGERR